MSSTMLNGRELASFRKQLLGWFRQFQRDLPWRRTKDPYRIWLSEIMLQQTRVVAAIPYYERFLHGFPDVLALASAPPEEILRAWSGLGYYSRARNLQKAAQQIVAKHGGQFPARLQDALALPGIGNYTAAAILSIAFGEKQPFSTATSRASLPGSARFAATSVSQRVGKSCKKQRTACLIRNHPAIGISP